MSYTINPNAKNKWARNAENTMDLSLETDASSVYLDNGRTLEQEIGEGSMVSNIATVDSAMSKVIDGTLDGAYESGVMYGKSLINLITQYHKNNKSQVLTISGRTYVVADRRDMLLKSNTKYLIQFSVSDLDLDGRSYVDLVFQQNTGVIFNGDVVVRVAQNGLYRVITTTIPLLPEITDSNWSQNAFVIKGMNSQWENTDSTARTLTLSEVMIIEYQEGMENWDIPYFTGLCDVKMPILRNVGKNLLSIQDYSPKGTLTNVEVTRNTLKATVEGVWHGFEYILQLKPNTEYTFSFERDSDTVKGYIRHPENKGWTGGYGGYSNYTFTTRGTGVIRFTIESSLANNTIIVRNPMIVEGNLRPTSYENYKSNILRTSEEVVLREVNGVQDTYSPLTGEYVQRIKEITFDGSSDENWGLNTTWSSGDYCAFWQENTKDKLPTGYAICDKLPSKHDNHLIQNNVAISEGWRYAHQNMYIFIAKSKLTSIDIEGLRQWLSQNPITVQYELAEPITTIVESLTTPFAYENGHIILESGHEGQSLLPTLEYSTVVNKTGLVENVAKTIQRQEKQLTILEQMLIQNIINLDYNNTLLTLKNEMEEML